MFALLLTLVLSTPTLAAEAPSDAPVAAAGPAVAAPSSPVPPERPIDDAYSYRVLNARATGYLGMVASIGAPGCIVWGIALVRAERNPALQGALFYLGVRGLYTGPLLLLYGGFSARGVSKLRFGVPTSPALGIVASVLLAGGAVLGTIGISRRDEPLLLAAGGVWLGGVTAGTAFVVRTTERAESRGGLGLQPTAVFDPEGRARPGLVVHGRF